MKPRKQKQPQRKAGCRVLDHVDVDAKVWVRANRLSLLCDLILLVHDESSQVLLCYTLSFCKKKITSLQV